MCGTTAVVGVGESCDYRPGASPDSEFQVVVTAITQAVADADLTLEAIDGFTSSAGERHDLNRAVLVPVRGTRSSSHWKAVDR